MISLPFVRSRVSRILPGSISITCRIGSASKANRSNFILPRIGTSVPSTKRSRIGFWTISSKRANRAKRLSLRNSPRVAESRSPFARNIQRRSKFPVTGDNVWTLNPFRFVFRLSPFAEGERIEVRGGGSRVSNKRNPHPALSLLKGEAKTSPQDY
jgi:hypothetical protein